MVLTKEYRICMPMTVEEVWIFIKVNVSNDTTNIDAVIYSII